MTLVNPRNRFAMTVALAAALLMAPAVPSAAQSMGKFIVTKMAEKPVDELPDGELYWHVERFDSIEAADTAAAGLSLTGEFEDSAWLFTLADRTAPAMGGTPVAKIGPVPRVDAPEYLLRVNNAVAPVGAKSSIHSHPGAEAFLVLSGQLTQHTPYGMHVLNSGGTMPGVPDQTMQNESTGDEELRQLIMFVVDATRPFSEKKEHLH